MMTPFGFSLLDELRPDRDELVIEEDENKYEIKMGIAGIKPQDITVQT
jgi:HSP20 family molecular chaperone IbpA